MTKASIEPSAPAAGTAAFRVQPRRAGIGSSRLSTWIRSIWRQRWLSLVSAWTVCVIGWLAVALWPSNYMSSAVIYADVHRLADKAPPGNGLSGAQSDQDPVLLLKSALLSDESLSSLRRATALDDQRVDTLEQDITIRSTAPTLFVASYDHRDPATAHLVLDRLFSSLSERISEAEVDIDAASSQQAVDLEKDIDDLEKKLKVADDDLAAFWEVNADFFKEIADPTIDVPALEQEIVALRQRIEGAIIERDEVAQQLANLPQSRQQPNEPAPSEPAVTPLSASQQDELRLLESKLVELRERYADTHPYVATVLTAIDALKAEPNAAASTTEESARNDTAPTGNSGIEAKLAELKQLHQQKIANHSALNKDLASKEREIDRLQALTEATTSVEAEQATLEGKKRDLKAALAPLIERRDAEQVTTGQQQAEQPRGQQEATAEQTSFKLINQPSLPDKPTGLPRLLCLALVLLGGVGIGGGMAVVRNHSKGVFESAWQLKQRFDVGVLGTISEVLSPAERKQLGYARLVFGAACLGLVGVFGGLAIAEFMNLLTPWGDRLRTQLLG